MKYKVKPFGKQSFQLPGKKNLKAVAIKSVKNPYKLIKYSKVVWWYFNEEDFKCPKLLLIFFNY